MHERARHLLEKNPDMPESMAFGIATQQAYAIGKVPKGYGTAEGRRTAKKKYRQPATAYEGRAHGHDVRPTLTCSVCKRSNFLTAKSLRRHKAKHARRG
jgi:hypothetical protein